MNNPTLLDKSIKTNSSKKLFVCVSAKNQTILSDQEKNDENLISSIKNEIQEENTRNLDFPNRRGEFHANFMNVQNHLGMANNLRRLQIDAVLKKCKSKFFKSVHIVLKTCLKCRVDRLPQKFITDIRIETNKKFMPMTILSIYQHFGFFLNMDQLFERNMVRDEKKSLLREFMSQTFKVLFETYLTSEQYQRDYDTTREENENLAVLFDYTCKIFTQYYTTLKGNNLYVRRTGKSENENLNETN
jgi:hypothetical protein